MRDNLNRSFTRLRTSFAGFTAGQKVVAVLGTAALLLAAVMVFQWAARPSYAPLYTNLASEDASAVIEQLDADGIPYEISGNGSTIMVPKSQVYETRIALSGEGLPGNSGQGGYTLLDNHDLSTSEFQEQTDFKRAMEGELATTIEAIDGVDTALVHLALPEKEVFAEEQDPATASVLLDTRAGSDLGPEQVQAVVQLVASSIDGLDPDLVTVADATGRVLSANESTGGAGATTRAQQVDDFQNKMNARIQAMLDRVVGPGNSTVQVTADLDFDKSVTESTTYSADEDNPPLSSSTSEETYNGPAGGTTATGVVGPDGQMDSPGVGGQAGSSYEKSAETEDNAVDTTVEHRETAPGSVNSLHTAIVLDAAAARDIDPGEVEDLVAAAIGIDLKRGDTVAVSSLPFDRSMEESAAAELEKAAALDKKQQQFDLLRKAGLVLLVLLVLLVAWLKGRRRNKARQQATTYVVEQLRQDQAKRATGTLEPNPALVALERAEHTANDGLRDELAALVERQPDEVATLLRGWLVERH